MIVSSAAWRRMLWLIRRLYYDDAVVFGNGYRVERLYLDAGLPHYRVFHADELVGVARIRHPSRLPIIQPGLAAYLIRAGCDPHMAAFRRDFAMTPPDAKTTRLPVLKLYQAAQGLTGAGSGLGYS